MSTPGGRTYHLCPCCFRGSSAPGACHGRPMLLVDCGPAGSAASRPLATPQGLLLTRAPRWWVEQVGPELFRQVREGSTKGEGG